LVASAPPSATARATSRYEMGTAVSSADLSPDVPRQSPLRIPIHVPAQMNGVTRCQERGLSAADSAIRPIGGVLAGATPAARPPWAVGGICFDCCREGLVAGRRAGQGSPQVPGTECTIPGDAGVDRHPCCISTTQTPGTTPAADTLRMMSCLLKAGPDPEHAGNRLRSRGDSETRINVVEMGSNCAFA
jgi:hypothetical protein